MAPRLHPDKIERLYGLLGGGKKVPAKKAVEPIRVEDFLAEMAQHVHNSNKSPLRRFNG